MSWSLKVQTKKICLLEQKKYCQLTAVKNCISNNSESVSNSRQKWNGPTCRNERARALKLYEQTQNYTYLTKSYSSSWTPAPSLITGWHWSYSPNPEVTTDANMFVQTFWKFAFPKESFGLSICPVTSHLIRNASWAGRCQSVRQDLHLLVPVCSWFISSSP